MGMLEAAAAKVRAGATVQVRPQGSSMTPLIRSGQLVTIAPANPGELRKGDVILVRADGSVRLHLVSAVNHSARRVQVSNNHGHVNGWAHYDSVFGICIAVDAETRPGTAARTRLSSGTGAAAARLPR